MNERMIANLRVFPTGQIMQEMSRHLSIQNAINMARSEESTIKSEDKL